MNGYQRTVNFVKGLPVDRPPFMPMTIEWVSKYENIPYPDFVYKPEVRANAYLDVCEKFNLDCVLPDTDFYEQLEDLGAKPVFDGKGYNAEPIIDDIDELPTLPKPTFKIGTRMGNRLEIIKRIAAKVKGEKYIFGICIGPFTEFCNARKTEDALCDILTDEEQSMVAVNMFYENCSKFIDEQLKAGADGIQIVEPCCSLISPEIYERLILPLHKKLVAQIQKNGAFSRLHICGDTNKIVPLTLNTGTHILDVDWQVKLDKVQQHLTKEQVFCGNLDPSGDVLMGKPDSFKDKVKTMYEKANHRIIIAAGCDVPPDTSVENLKAFYDACESLK